MSRVFRIGNWELDVAQSDRRNRATRLALICGTVAWACCTSAAKADQGGVSFWIPGFFGSLAAAPLQPGWTLQTNYYHTSVSAGADVARAREITIGRIPITANANLSATLDAKADLGWAMPLYTFATPVLGGQATVGVIGMYGRVSTSLAGTLAGTVATPLGTFSFTRSDGISDDGRAFGDLIPLATMRWNAGVHNYMTYINGDFQDGGFVFARS